MIKKIGDKKIIDLKPATILIVISGPSGVGKSTVVKELLNKYQNLSFSVSFTTRTPREKEINGLDYQFIGKEEFEKKIFAGEFLEWAKVYGNYYGTPRKFVEETLLKGYDVILDIDTQGAIQVKNKLPNSVLIFLLPPFIKELKRRLIGRGTETNSSIEFRLKQVEIELKDLKYFDYWVINHNISETVSTISGIIEAEKRKVNRVNNLL